MVPWKEPFALLELICVGSSSYLPRGLVHIVPDVPKDINEYTDSEGEGELADIYYSTMGLPWTEPWSRVGRPRLASVFSSVKLKKKRNSLLKVIVKI